MLSPVRLRLLAGLNIKTAFWRSAKLARLRIVIRVAGLDEQDGRFHPAIVASRREVDAGGTANTTGLCCFGIGQAKKGSPVLSASALTAPVPHGGCDFISGRPLRGLDADVNLFARSLRYLAHSPQRWLVSRRTFFPSAPAKTWPHWYRPECGRYQRKRPKCLGRAGLWRRQSAHA